MLKIQRMALLLIVSLVLSLLAAACGSSSAPAGGSTANPSPGAGAQSGGDKKEPPTEISIMSTFYTPEPPGEDNVIVKEVEKRTNTKLKITWVSQNNYQDKINLTLASGDIPDLMLATEAFHPQVRTMTQQGAFWDLTEQIKQYPNLMKYPQDTWTNTKMQDGKNYGIPRVRPTEGGSFMYIRQDWLEKLGLKMPETTDDLYNAMKEFAAKKLDGKPETYGMTGNVNSDNMGNLQPIFNIFSGTNGTWKVQDGKLVNSELEKGARDALVWMNKAYQEKLIPEDFSVLKPSQSDDLITGGRAGIGFQTPEYAWGLTSKIRETNPKADLIQFMHLTGPSGKFTSRDSGFFGMFLIPKKVPEAKMKKILAFMDYGASDEGSDLASYGLKDIHYVEKDGFKLATDQAKKDIVAQQAFGQIFISYDKYLRAYRVGMPKEIYERNKKIVDERAKVSIADPAIGLYSETSLRIGKEYDKKIQDLKIKVIMNKEPISAWDQMVEQLKKDAQYQKIITEINDSYKKRMGK